MFRYFRVSKNFKLQMVMSRFPVECFRLTVPKSFVEEPFSAVFQKSSASENVYGKEGGGRVPIFHVTIFCLLVLKISVREPF